MTHDPSEPLGGKEADWRTLCERITREGGACDLTAYGDISAAMTERLCDALISTSAEVGVIDARGARFPEGLDLTRLRKCKGLDLSGARIEADFTLGDPRRRTRDGEHELITYQGKGVVVGSAGIDLHGANVRGNVVLAFEQVGGGINMASLKVCGQVSIQGVAPVRVDFSATGQPKILDRPTKLPLVQGNIFLAGAEMSGSLSIRDATIDGVLGYDRRISRSADEPLCKLGALNLYWVEVIGAIDLASLASGESIELNRVNCAGICFDKSSVAASVTVTKCYIDRLAIGAIFSATNADVEGDLKLTGGYFGRITLDSAKISGHIHIGQCILRDSILLRKLRVDGGLAIIDIGADPKGDSLGHITLTDCQTVGDVEIRKFDRAGLQLTGSFDSITLDALNLSFIRLADLVVKRDFSITDLSLGVPRDSADAHSEGPGTVTVRAGPFNFEFKAEQKRSGPLDPVATVGGLTRIEGCDFNRPFVVENCALVGGLCLIGTLFEMGMTIADCSLGPRTRIEECEVKGKAAITSCQFGSESQVRDIQISDKGNSGLNLARSSLVGATVEGENVDVPLIIASLEHVDVKGTTLRHVDLKSCILGEAQHLDAAEVRGTVTLSSTPGGLSRVQLDRGGRGAWWIWTQREVVADEVKWRCAGSPKRWRLGGGRRGETRRLEAARIAEIYRGLLEALGQSAPTTLSSDLRYGQLEMRRRSEERRWDRCILHLFWCFGGYALRPLRPMLWFAALALAGGTILSFAGTSRSEGLGWGRSLVTAARTMVALPPNLDTFSTGAQVVITVLRLAGPVLLGFVLFAARSRARPS
jgi:hypothetical protein